MRIAAWLILALLALGPLHAVPTNGGQRLIGDEQGAQESWETLQHLNQEVGGGFLWLGGYKITGQGGSPQAAQLWRDMRVLHENFNAPAHATATALWEMTEPLRDHAVDSHLLVLQLLTGRWDDPDAQARWDRLSADHQFALFATAEILALLHEELAGASPRELGFISGRITFEVLALAVPARGAAALNKATVLTRLRAARVSFGKAGLDTAWARSINAIAELLLGLRTTRMCFVAGTLVATGIPGSAELIHRPIEMAAGGQPMWRSPGNHGRFLRPRNPIHAGLPPPSRLGEVFLRRRSGSAAWGWQNRPLFLTGKNEGLAKFHMEP